jgi:predicted N-acetyltransferase YhbS
MIERLHEPLLTARDEARIAALLRACFPTDYGGRSFFMQRPHMRLVWREDQILSHVALFYRAVRLGDDLIDVMGLGDVATAPQARGRGLATALLSDAIDIARASGAHYMMLFGARGLYERAGFLPAANPYTQVGMTGARTGVVTRAHSPFFRVLPLGQAAWPATAEVDFMGPLF